MDVPKHQADIIHHEAYHSPTLPRGVPAEIPGSRTAGHSGEDGQVGQDRDGPGVAGGECIEGGSFQGSKVVIPYIIYK